MKFISVNTASEFICFLVAFVFLWKDKSTTWKMLIAFLLLTCVTEVTGIYMREFLQIRNYPVYNVYLLFECGFTSYFFYHLYRPYNYHIKWLYVWYGIFMLIFLSEMLHNNFKGFTSATASIMSVVFVLASLYFYYLKLRDEKFEPLLYSASFWWVNGALFFYFGSTACNIFMDYLAEYESITYNNSIRYIIYNVLDVIMYACWSYAFICRYRQRKLSFS
ncbi:hypothetical protein INP83_14615 [Mucilaginibacter sp. 21P]|uniref:hypothetical protein n=1 Tax=Mucilaginibacter sp. 21P TaxID=2778902 RepID=UPI001C560D3A|nr:hypothetical protein [Mucilaginibacter sp. 21P]QXV64315.1 hypothetical protein INP83_14615 [Mucilaginibacter sp. 21P]